MEINLVELWAGMGFPVRMVVFLLSVQAVACVAVLIDRLVLLTQSGKRAREFAASVKPAMEAAEYDRVVQAMGETKPNHLTGYLEQALTTFLARVRHGDSPQRAAELSKRALERKGDAINRDLNRGMNVLASTGSTAPFIGLLGTVLGIINAFRMIAATGSGGIGTIGAAIGEALVVTGYGLIVAIPSVLIFNWLSSRIANYEAMLINAGSELLDRLETGATGASSPPSSSSPSPTWSPVVAGR
jgi:biopolymer transport protein ExbB/TolQ